VSQFHASSSSANSIAGRPLTWTSSGARPDPTERERPDPSAEMVTLTDMRWLCDV